MNLQSVFWRACNYLKFCISGVSISNGIKEFNVKNKIYLQIKKSGTVKIGRNFTFFSGDCLNPLSRNLRGCISVDDNATLIIGDNVGISASTIRCRKQITIGNRVTIGADVLLLDSDGHSLDYKKRGTHDDIPNCKPIVIYDDVLIGARTIVLKGVTIGARTIIGGGSVVSKDIPSDCIAAGNPCKVIKYLNKNSLPCQNDNHSNNNPQQGGGSFIIQTYSSFLECA